MLGSDKASTLPNIKGRFIVKDDELYEVQAFYYDSDNIYKDEDIDNDIDLIEDEEIIEYNKEYNDIENVINDNYKEVKKINQTENSNEIIFDFSDFKNK